MTVHARVLGIAQDAGVPHTGCSCARCERWRPTPLYPACLGLVVGGRSFLIDATPAFAEQIRMLPSFPEAILLTHVHMGHVAGLLQLGEEACDVAMKVYAPQGACDFLRDNAPWSYLRLDLCSDSAFELGTGLSVETVPVNHRGIDTVGYLVRGPSHRLLYLPDIDRWDLDLSALLARCDLALLDGSFYTRHELGRQHEVAHPPIVDTLALLSDEEAAKVRFFHFNHTNPVLDEDGPQVLAAVQGDTIALA